MRNGRTLILLGAAVIGSALLSWTVHRAGQAELERKQLVLAEQAQQLALQAAENQSLSNLLALMKSSGPLSEEQMRELLRLRNQVGQLHRLQREARDLSAANQKLQADLVTAGIDPGGEVETIASVGFDAPEAALKTTLWAWTAGQPEAFLASCTPAERMLLEQEWAKLPPDELSTRCKVLAGIFQPATAGVRLLGTKSTSPSEALLEVYFEGDGKRREFELRRFGEEWRVTGLRRIFN